MQNISSKPNFVIMKGSTTHKRSYKTLIAFQKSEVIYDMTYYFCNKYLRRGDRTIDQMGQAARSGKQNIVEGVEAAVTSYETLLKLLNVARASLHELLVDYEDYLRVRNLKLWDNDSVEVRAMRELGKTHTDSAYFLSLAETRSDEVVANMVIVLIHQADILIGNYYDWHYNKFLNEGGYREKLTRELLSHRNGE